MSTQVSAAQQIVTQQRAIADCVLDIAKQKVTRAERAKKEWLALPGGTTEDEEKQLEYDRQSSSATVEINLLAHMPSDSSIEFLVEHITFSNGMADNERFLEFWPCFAALCKIGSPCFNSLINSIENPSRVPVRAGGSKDLATRLAAFTMIVSVGQDAAATIVQSKLNLTTESAKRKNLEALLHSVELGAPKQLS